MPLPLEGIRIVDWTIWQQGTVASCMLADLGADVIKIEERTVGDPGRGVVNMGGMDVSDRPNFYFEANNRNKRSVAVDLRTPEGRELVQALAEKSDVFMQNFRKGVAGRLGLDAKTLRARNSKLIYASATGYGRDGPDSGEPSFDFLGLARSGIMYSAGEPGGPPLPIAGGIADQMGGIMLAYGVMTALVVRERLGIAQDVDASHLGSMAYLQGLSLSMKLMMGGAMPRMSRETATQSLWNHYRCKDDQWIALAMLQADRYWADFARALGRPDLVDHEKFKDMIARAQNAEEVIATLDAIFATKTRDDWMQVLRDEPGDFIYTVVNDVNQLADDPQMRVNDYIVEFDHPQHGPTEMVGFPVQFSETPGSLRIPAPELGQHTEEILLDVLGYDWERIADLRKRDVI
jgi:crotonobetainyl-CoA:carnitine CoA-transferase CaiB-like acyl-CoA transferase